MVVNILEVKKNKFWIVQPPSPTTPAKNFRFKARSIVKKNMDNFACIRAKMDAQFLP